MENCRGLVSIVVPVFNVESYLAECIESLREQTYENLEIVLVDDSSTDQSLDICRRYAALDDRIKVFHKPNGGAASARNLGLDVLSGEFICLVDSDDVVSPHYIERLLSAMQTCCADVSICSFVHLYQNGKVENPVEYPNTCMSQVDYLKRFLTDWTCGIAWNKMFRTELVKNVRYEEGHKIDDEFFTYLAIMESQKVVIFNEPLYYYRMRASSVMRQSNSYRNLIIQDRVEYTMARYENVKKGYPMLKKQYLSNLAVNMIKYRGMSIGDAKLSGFVRECMRKYLPEILMSPINWKQKISFIKHTFTERRSASIVHEMEQHEDLIYTPFE